MPPPTPNSMPAAAASGYTSATTEGDKTCKVSLSFDRYEQKVAKTFTYIVRTSMHDLLFFWDTDRVKNMNAKYFITLKLSFFVENSVIDRFSNIL